MFLHILFPSCEQILVVLEIDDGRQEREEQAKPCKAVRDDIGSGPSLRHPGIQPSGDVEKRERESVEEENRNQDHLEGSLDLPVDIGGEYTLLGIGENP